jgi:hypothetical protein
LCNNRETRHKEEEEMSQCHSCNTTENLVYSGVDALMLRIDGAQTGVRCYECADKERTEKIEKEKTDGSI